MLYLFWSILKVTKSTLFVFSISFVDQFDANEYVCVCRREKQETQVTGNKSFEKFRIVQFG